MSQIEEKLQEINRLHDLQQRDQWMNQFHPLVKFVLSISYIILVISIGKYQPERMILMAVYIIVAYQMADLSIRDALWRVRLILPLVLAVGIFNPLLDHSPGMQVGGVMISGGVISMFCLMLKGVYSVLSAYLLIATTTIEEICYAMRMLHVPKILVTVILLTYRYVMILGEEADRIMTAYQLRAPSQKGIHYSAWGSLVGQWLLRSFDRAERIYESMTLRGFKGEFTSYKVYHARARGLVYFSAWLLVFLLLRFVPLSF